MTVDAKPEDLLEDEYLGDGVYASFDGYYIVLDLRDQDNYTRIALEPMVIENFNRYADKIRKTK